MDAGRRTINDFFNGNRILEIPFFQRSYVWDIEQWDRLLEDMQNVSATNKPYFLGSIILKQIQTSSSNNIGDVRTVIDGQQRLTTLCIFFKVLALKTGESKYFERAFLTADDEPALKHNFNDVEAFSRIVCMPDGEPVLLEGKDNVTRAYNYFVKNVDVECYHNQRLLNNLIFVGIDLAADEDEQQIFDTINSLGVKLTTAELLKNHLFNRNSVEEYEKYWRSVFEKDDEVSEYWNQSLSYGRYERTFIDAFFYAYLQVKISDGSYSVRAEDKIAFGSFEKLFESYKTFIKEYVDPDLKEFLEDIKSHALRFRSIFDIGVIEEELPKDDGLKRINAIIFALNTTTLIPYVLFVESNVTDQQTKEDIYQFLESYVMRRIVVRASNRAYNQLFGEQFISNRLLDKEALLNYFSGREDVANYIPDDKELKDGFMNSKLINRQSAGVLYFIESKLRGAMHSTQLLGIKKYSLEHLMPKKWQNHWGKLDNQSAIDERNRVLLTLGNLTIITQSLNTSIRDANWETKLNGKGKNGGLKKYSEGIETISEFLNLPEWNEEEIQKRANTLYELALQFWSL